MTNAVKEGLSKARAAIVANNRFVNALTFLLFPAALSIWTSQATPEKVGAFWFYAVIAIISAVQIAAFSFLNHAPSDDVPEMLFDYHEQQHRLADAEAIVGDLQHSLENTVAALVLGRFWAARQANLARLFSSGEVQLVSACASIIEPLIAQGQKLFAFSFEDVWSIAVYRWNPVSLRLEPVWWKRAPAHPSGDDTPRSWRDGEGHCGTSFMSQTTLFTNDLGEESTFNRVRPTPDNVRDYDAATYRSFATVPLTIGTDKLGVVAITSDRIGRFGPSNVTVVEELGDVLAQVLWIDAIASDSAKA